MDAIPVQVERIAHNYNVVMENVARAASKTGRSREDIKIIVVTKAHPIEKVKAAIQAGLRIFGENYAEEGAEKISMLKEHPSLEWHMIGHIQSRKAELICRYFHWVHSLDSVKLANRLNRFAGMYQRKIPVLLQFNISGESTKFGWPAWDEGLWEGWLEEVSEIINLPNLEVQGVMGIPPFEAQGETARMYFRRLRRLREFLRKNVPQLEWPHLSMGMSADYEVAVEEGATMLRIGTAILGSRP